MAVRGQVVGQLLDGMESVGVDRRELLAAVTLDPAALLDERATVEWSRVVTMIDLCAHKLGGDVDRLRLAGRAVARATRHSLLVRLSRPLPLRAVYALGMRWGWLAGLPVSVSLEPRADRTTMLLRAEVAEPHASSVALNHLIEGSFMELPSLVGHPPATIASSRVTARSLEAELVLARAPRGERLRRAIRAALGSPGLIDELAEQRRALEEALVEAQRSTAENRELLDRLPVFVMIHRDGVLLWLNRANLDALGYANVEDVVGRTLLDLVEPESREFIRDRMRTPVGSNLPPLSQIRLLARNGRVIVTEIAPAQTVTFRGKPARLIVGRDVTELAQLQRQLLVADRMASVGLLTAGVAHEVNNPLTYVMSSVELARRALAPLGDAGRDVDNLLDTALAGADRIRTIVRDLLALSRVDDVVGPVDLAAVVESTIKLARRNIEDRAALEVAYEAAPKVAGNAARLGQVVLNLVTNALQSMPVRPREQNLLRVVVRAAAGGAVIEVGDNGAGIAPEHAGRVFDPFFTTKAAGAGTGLGLAICQRIITEMGGTISFETAPQAGTTFRVFLASWAPRAPNGVTAGAN